MAWPANDASVLPDKSCLIAIKKEGELLQWWTSSAVIVPKNGTITAGVTGRCFTLGALPIERSTPFIASFKAVNDRVVFAYKVVGTSVYLMCVDVEYLKDFQQLDRGKFLNEAAVFSMVKLPSADMTEVRELVNTETHKLADKASLLIAATPMFNFARIKSVDDLKKMVKQSSKLNIGRAFDGSTMRMRKEAKEKGEAAKDNGVAVAEGSQAATELDRMKSNLMEQIEFYEDDFLERIIPLQLGADGLPTEDSVKKAREQIELAKKEDEAELMIALDGLLEALKTGQREEIPTLDVGSPIAELVTVKDKNAPLRPKPFFIPAAPKPTPMPPPAPKKGDKRAAPERAAPDSDAAPPSGENQGGIKRGRPIGSTNGGGGDDSGKKLGAVEARRLQEALQVARTALAFEKGKSEGALATLKTELKECQEARDAAVRKVAKQEMELRDGNHATKTDLAIAQTKLKALAYMMKHMSEMQQHVRAPTMQEPAFSDGTAAATPGGAAPAGSVATPMPQLDFSFFLL